MKRIRTVQLPYNVRVDITMPKRTHFTELVCQIDDNNANVKPRLVYCEDTLWPQLVKASYILLRGECDVEAAGCKPDDFQFVGLGWDRNRRHNQIATLWRVTPLVEVDKPIAQPKKKPVPQPSPESLAAIEDHNKKIRLEQERLAAIRKEAEADLPLADPSAILEPAPEDPDTDTNPDPAPDFRPEFAPDPKPYEPNDTYPRKRKKKSKK